MEKFLALPREKQNAILDAGLKAFGKMGYRKTSVNDIALAAGVSKAMLFHYFGSKKNMYLYLLSFAYETFTHALQTNRGITAPDFFDRILASMKIKLGVLKQHPSIFQFLFSVYTETDPDVQAELKEFLKQSLSFRDELVFTELDRGKFKDTVQPELVLRILVGYSKGCIGNNSMLSPSAMDAILDEMTTILSMMKANFYKEEYV